jgi:hypothetical protein
MSDSLATIEPEGRLELSSVAHPLEWLPLQGGAVLITIVDRGCLLIEMLAGWAQRRQLPAEQAEALLVAWEMKHSVLPDLSPYSRSEAKRKADEYTGRPGPGRRSYRISLPAKALWALLPQNEGPLVLRGQRQGLRLPGTRPAQVLVQGSPEGVYLFSEMAFGHVRTDLAFTRD